MAPEKVSIVALYTEFKDIEAINGTIDSKQAATA